MTGTRIAAPPLVYVAGEEMTRYVMSLVLDRWIRPHMDIGAWAWFDLSVRNRDATGDAVLRELIAKGGEIGAIFKEPTITPTVDQARAMGLSKAWGSPNGAMRRGWNGFTISRDTIHVPGLVLGFERPVLFDRHAVGGEYEAGFGEVGRGTIRTVFVPEDGGSELLILERRLTDAVNEVVTYHNPIDNVGDLAHHFFTRALAANVVPWVVTKKTVFKWQEAFWARMKEVYDAHYRDAFRAKGLVAYPDGSLGHLISDAATMQLLKWKEGGFAMAAHNYDGDILTDEISQIHCSPGFITSVLTGKALDGRIIKCFEASHGTAADMDAARQRGEATSFNPLGMTEALVGAIEHAANLTAGFEPARAFAGRLRAALHETLASGDGTRDVAGPSGATTEVFVERVAERLAS
jgi:isocitrate dehydrogenase